MPVLANFFALVSNIVQQFVVPPCSSVGMHRIVLKRDMFSLNPLRLYVGLSDMIFTVPGQLIRRSEKLYIIRNLYYYINFV